VTKTQSAGPISRLEYRATRVLHCAIVTRAAVLIFPFLLQTIISNQMRPRMLRGAWFSRLLRHPARRRSGSIQAPEPTVSVLLRTGTDCRRMSWKPRLSHYSSNDSTKIDLTAARSACSLTSLPFQQTTSDLLLVTVW